MTRTTPAAPVAPTTTEGPGDRGPAGAPARRPLTRRIAGDVRTRILASYIVLLLVAAVASTLIVRQALLVRLDDRIEDDLTQEVQEFRRLADGNDPETGRAVRHRREPDLRRLSGPQRPGEGEELITVPARGAAALPLLRARRRTCSRSHTSRAGDGCGRPSAARSRRPPDRPATSPCPSSTGTAPSAHSWSPISSEPEREEVNEAVLIVAAVAGGVLVLGTAAAFLGIGRVLAPCSELRDAALSVSGAEMRRRIAVDGEEARSRSSGAPSTPCSTDSSRRSRASASSFAIGPRAAHPSPSFAATSSCSPRAGSTTKATAERRIALVTGELDRMSRFVDDLLLLAKHDQPDFLELETVDLERALRRAARQRAGARRARVEHSTTRSAARSSPIASASRRR